ncbi:hypothetical protein [Anoxybacillus flavithermus]|uniref:hypothetical protein n=1 Tax=Anoxybacillus flavithermus TaxID=33934 RepID=UPI001F0C7631|nr:hypothetical protein [Anoxybacillus flavithermus]
MEESINKAKLDLESKKVELSEMEELQRYIPVWREVFEKVSVEKKKMMLSTVIDKIVVFRDRVEITFKISLNRFLVNEGSHSNNDALAMDYGRVSENVENKRRKLEQKGDCDFCPYSCVIYRKYAVASNQCKA